jgi:hypothetical protein
LLALLLACGSDPTKPDDIVDTDPTETGTPDTDPPTAPEDTGATGDTGAPDVTGTTTDAYGCVTDHDEPLDSDCPCWTELDAVLAGRGLTDTGIYGNLHQGEPDWVPCEPPTLLPAEDQATLDAEMATAAPGETPPTSIDFATREALLLHAQCTDLASYQWENARVCEADGRAVLDFRHEGKGATTPSRPWWVLDVPRASYDAVEIRVHHPDTGY